MQLGLGTSTTLLRRIGEFVDELRVNISSPNTSPIEAGTVTFSGNATGPDPITTLEYQIDDGVFTSFTVAENWTVDIGLDLTNTSVTIRATDDQLETDTATFNFTAQDTTAPVVGDSNLSTNPTSSSITATFTKATDSFYAQSTLVYELYSGDQQELSSLATIKNQTLEDSGTDVSQLVISDTGQGELYYYNVLVRDPSGNEAIYTVSSDVTLDPEILSFDLLLDGTNVDVDNIFEGDATDQATLSWDINQQDGADDDVTVESLDTDLVIVETLNQTVNGSGSAVLEIQSTGTEDTGIVRVYPTFYGSYNDTPASFRYEIQIVRQVYESESETQSAVYQFEA